MQTKHTSATNKILCLVKKQHSKKGLYLSDDREEERQIKQKIKKKTTQMFDHSTHQNTLFRQQTLLQTSFQASRNVLKTLRDEVILVVQLSSLSSSKVVVESRNPQFPTLCWGGSKAPPEHLGVGGEMGEKEAILRTDIGCSSMQVSFTTASLSENDRPSKKHSEVAGCSVADLRFERDRLDGLLKVTSVSSEFSRYDADPIWYEQGFSAKWKLPLAQITAEYFGTFYNYG